ncbi:hypothetical protein [Nonomuraea guangzhouensis]|uniref:Uncharacterized protein n=1 Tax=Nonomuraea guangzhouensis TaxID=1291555 RepID=A0ABW4GXZ8_9ACTN|nr:hypothetical protein [Nonomuraea guangzhouensis]
MRVLAGNCRSGNCPTAYELADGKLGIQGYTVETEGLPAGESMVSVPPDLILELADRLRAEATP